MKKVICFLVGIVLGLGIGAGSTYLYVNYL
jgi:hypothetical protein